MNGYRAMEHPNDRVKQTFEDLPYLWIGDAYIDLTEPTAAPFTVFLSPGALTGKHYLVIDVYSARDHVHPSGHVGWWQRDLDDAGRVSAEMRRDDSGITVVFPRYRGSIEQWFDRSVMTGLDEDVLAVHAVLREKGSNAIAYDETVLAYQSRETLGMAEERRNRPAEDLATVETAAHPWYLWPANRTVHLVTVSFRDHDGVGSFVLGLYRLLKAHSIPVAIYAHQCDPELKGFVRPVPELLACVGQQDLVFFHFSIFDPFFDLISALPCRKILYFHGITPPRSLQVFHPELARLCEKGMEQAPLALRFDALMANSKYSAAELLSWMRAIETSDSQSGTQSPAGSLQVTPCPPRIGMDHFAGVNAVPPVRTLPRSRLLFVGRIAPHKRIEDLIELFAAYRTLDPDSCMVLIGGISSAGYWALLQHMLGKQSPETRDSVIFTGEISQAELLGYYQAASAFVTMSEHEGFCLPLVEAMAFDLPVFAYAHPAMRETLGRSGRVFYEKDFQAFAADMFRVIHDRGNARSRIVASQRQRFEELKMDTDGAAIWHVLEEVMFPDARAL
jgi:glycosyltransferase involved in cell wall biosynthesis